MAHNFRSYKDPRGINDATRCCKCYRPKGTQELCVDDGPIPWWADERRGGQSLLGAAMTLRLSKARGVSP